MNISQLIHLWANDTTGTSRYAGNVYCERGTIYSYGRHFPMARHITGPKNQPAILFTTRRYSVTTSGHMSEVRRAIPGHIPVFEVVDVNSDDRKAQLADMKKALAQLVLKAKRARVNKPYLQQQLLEDAKKINTFIAFFKLRAKPVSNECIEKLGAEAAKFEEQRLAEEARERKAAERRLREDLKEWLAGEYRPGVRQLKTIYLRHLTSDEGEYVETSHGASVSLDDARRLFEFVAAHIRKEKEYQFTPGERELMAGHFQLRSIDRQGNVVVGCHHFKWEQIEDFADRMGWLNVTATAA